MPHAFRNPDEWSHAGGLAPFAGRPLFVPPGISVVRTGPTTRAELDRLLADAGSSEVSGVRLSPTLAPPAPRTWSRLLALFGVSPTSQR